MPAYENTPIGTSSLIVLFITGLDRSGSRQQPGLTDFRKLADFQELFQHTFEGNFVAQGPR